MLAPIIADNLRLPGIAHGFFTREGGVSSGIYAALNCGLGSDDVRTDVIENRSRVARHLGAGELVTLHQVHSATALIVDGRADPANLPRADALVTTRPGLAIGALSADCTPILLADPVARVVGAAHAGWRGAVGGILEATIATMVHAGARRERIAAAIGPCINQPAYEVGPEFEAQFIAADASTARFFSRATPDARPHFDLPGFVESRLARAGIATVARHSHCTFAERDRMFSYRRTQQRHESDYGRQVSAIALTAV